MPVVNVNFDTAIFNDKFLSHLENHSRVNIFYGGAGSGKSVFVAQRALYRCLKEPYYRLIFCRKIDRSIRNSQFLLFKDLIAQYGLDSLFQCKESTMDIICKNGNMMLSAGLNDVERLKSIQEPNDIWCEEITEFTKQDILQLNLRLRTRKARFNQLTGTFNPISIEHWIYDSFFANKEIRADIIHSTYKDNKFISEDYRQQLEDLEQQDLNYYNVYALGLWGGAIKGQIYAKWQACSSIPDGCEILYGLDFGFNVPTALVKIGIKENNIYVQQQLYRSGLTNSDLINELRSLSIGRQLIYADAAEPQRIEEIYRAGFNIKPADKSPGSVKKGIDSIKARNLYITEDSTETIKEIRGYKWAEDKNGKALEDPVKFLDHAMDAMRYPIHSHLTKPSGKYTVR